MVALCVLTGRDWLDGPSRADPTRRTCAGASAVTLGLVYAQVVVGAWLRHFGDGRRPGRPRRCSRRPSGATPALLAWRVERQDGRVPALVPSARALALAVTLPGRARGRRLVAAPAVRRHRPAGDALRRP